MPFWGIWCMERVQFNDGNIGRWTEAMVYVVAREPNMFGDTFVGPPASRFGLAKFEEHALESLGSRR